MKSKLLLLSFIMLLTIVIGYSQTSANTAGIAVQGIARDANNTARINTSVSLSFEIYYLNNSNNAISIYTENVTLETDAFGVFSHVVDPGAANNAVIANNVAYLRISEGSIIISDEKFKHVPYAIAANNGVPTGSIMPFVGTTAPPGWVLCDGNSLTSVPGSASLIGLLGSNNSPNLQGMFLRGTGVSPVNGVAGPALKENQGDYNKSHFHGPGSLGTNYEPDHNHNDGGYNRLPGIDVNTTEGVDDSTGELNLHQSGVLQPSGGHSHTITTGATAASGGSETRPVNYGVNYIIKL